MSLAFKPSSLVIVYSTQHGIQLSDVTVSDRGWNSFGPEAKSFFPEKSSLDWYLGVEEDFGPWHALARVRPAIVFFAHEICWSLLVKHFEDEDPSLDVLFEVCRNIPFAEREIREGKS